MPANTTHPFYDDMVDDWVDCRTAVKGETAVRSDIMAYLPVPPGMGEPQTRTFTSKHGKFQKNDRYSWYASFAEFPEIVAPTLEAFQGLIHEKAPIITIPEKMEYLRENATPNGDSLNDLWKMTTREFMLVGREALVGEVVGDKPLSVPYPAESLINWRVSNLREGSVVSLAVLRESVFEPEPEDEFGMQLITRYRELRLLPDGTYGVRLWKSDATPITAVTHDQHLQAQIAAQVAATEAAPSKEAQPEQDDDGFVRPQLMGSSFRFVPIDVGNAAGIGFNFGHIPILPMAKLAFSIFRRSADYNRALYNKGDPQAYIVGDIADGDEPETIGGSELWILPPGSEAGYLDIDGQGIPLMREAINDDFERFSMEAGRFLETTDRVNPNESGRAVEKRLSAQRVTLRSLVIEAGALMERHLKTLAKMLGLSQAEIDAIKFEPNMDFTEMRLSGQEILQMISAKNMGLPWSQRSIHANLKAGGLTDMTFEEEMKAVSEEQELPGPTAEFLLTTGLTDGHRHQYSVDADQTEEADGHTHPIDDDGVIGPADGHTHAADTRASAAAPKPAPTGAPNGMPGDQPERVPSTVPGGADD